MITSSVMAPVLKSKGSDDPIGDDRGGEIGTSDDTSSATSSDDNGSGGNGSDDAAVLFDTAKYLEMNPGFGGVDDLYHFFVVAFAAAPGVEYMSQLTEARDYGLSVREIVNIFTTKPQFTSVYPETLSDDQLASRLIDNIVKDSASDADKLEAVHDIKDALELGWSRGDVIHQVFGNLADKPLDDPQWGATAQQFQNQTAVARYLTEVMAYDTTDLSTLQAVLADVTPYTDVSTPEQIAQLIGVALG